MDDADDAEGEMDGSETALTAQTRSLESGGGVLVEIICRLTLTFFPFLESFWSRSLVSSPLTFPSTLHSLKYSLTHSFPSY